MVFAAIERGGEARAAVVPSASAAALDPLMLGWFDRDAKLFTDELRCDRSFGRTAAVYNWFGTKMRAHHAVNHSRGEYARTEGGLRVHTNTAEGFFGLFKRGIFGIHHHVSGKHLHRYAAEHCFRYNRRKHDAAELRCDPSFGRTAIARCLIGRHGRLRLRELLA